MTNSRLTDPEVLGCRLPVQILVIETPGGGGYGPPSPDPHQAGDEIDDLRAF
jgi:5-oxoprolinase (ATP-hydrolysing)